MDAFADVLARLRASLLAESVQLNRMPVIVAALSLDILETFWQHRQNPPVAFRRFGDSGRAVVQTGPAGAVLWMDPAADGYRDVFGRFLRDHWGVAAHLTRSGYDVDHVYNRARARQYGYGLVRMFLVPAAVNQDHGRGYEKGIGAAERDRHVKPMKLLDGMSELKLLGFPAVRNGLLTQAHHEAARLAAERYGIPIDVAANTLRDLCARATAET